MFRRTIRKLLCVVAVAVSVISLTANRADAGWHHWGGYYGGGYGYHATYYAPAYYSSFYRSPRVISYGWSSYSPVVYRARSCFRPRYRSCYTPYYASYYTPCYSSCYTPCYSPCYSGCYTSCGCSYCCGAAVGCCTGQVVVQKSPSAPIQSEPADSAPPPTPPAPAPVDQLPPAPAEDASRPAPIESSSPLPDPGPVAPTPPAPAPPAPAPGDAFPADAAPAAPAPAVPNPELPGLPPSSDLPPAPNDANIRSGSGSAVLSVVVPEDAKIYVNGILTNTPGTHRQYVSHGLMPGFRYTYEIEAVVNRRGRLIRNSQVIDVRAGETRDLALNLNDLPSATAVATLLTVHVPEDAEVQLEGRTANAGGKTRRFTTLDLPKGEQWASYRVVATVQRNGQSVRQEKTLSMTGGESHELRFDFDSERLALR